MTTPIDPSTLSGVKLVCRAALGTTLASGKVSAWADQSSNHNDLSQSTAGSRPTFVADAGDGQPALSFDGVDDVFIPLTNLITGAGSPFTIIATARVADGVDGYLLSVGGSVGGTANVAVQLKSSTGEVVSELATDSNTFSSTLTRKGAASELATIVLREDTAVGLTFTPPSLSGLALWLDASTNVTLSGSNVTTWQDARGGSNPTLSTVAGAGATVLTNVPLTGEHALRLSGSDSMTAAFTLGATVTIFAVYKQVAIFAPANHDIIFDGNTAATDIYATDNSDGDALYAGSVLATTGKAPTLGVYDYVTIQFNGAASIFRRGGSAGTLSANPGSGGAMNGLSIGSIGRFPQIDLAAVIVYNRILTGPEIAQVEGYLVGTYFSGGLFVANFLQRGGLDAADVTTTTPGGNAAVMTGRNLVVGAKGTGSPFVASTFYTGLLRDVVVFDRELTTSEYQGVFEFLSAPAPNPDTSPPSIGPFVPARGTQGVASTTPLTFNVTDTGSGVTTVIIGYLRPDTGQVDEVFDGTSFQTGYAVGSTVGTIANGFAFSVVRDAGWIMPTAAIVVEATDGVGNLQVEFTSFGIASPGADVTPPTISNITPAPGTPIARTQPIEFDAGDNVGLRRVVVKTTFVDLVTEEIVHDGDGFSPGYSTSSRAAISGGFHYVVTRRGGWPASPTLKIIAIDDSGNEV